jgi:hypothetical protein
MTSRAALAEAATVRLGLYLTTAGQMCSVLTQ